MFDWISFSIDSTDEFVNEAIGRGREHLGIVVKLLELCHSKIKIKINTVANQYNLNDLETIYQLISTYHIDRWKIFRFYPLRRGNKNRDLFYVDEWESQEIERFVAEKRNIQRCRFIIIILMNIRLLILIFIPMAVLKIKIPIRLVIC